MPILEAVNLALYLCSEEPDLSERVPPEVGRPSPIKTKKQGLKFFPPASPHVITVGAKLAAELRVQREQFAASHPRSGERAPITPHLRRAHWHGYWKGARDSPDRQFSVKWQPPLLVAPRQKETMH